VAEPPPAWRVATPLVVDCSLVAALLFDEEERDQAARSMAGHALHAPQLLDAELANVAVQKSRRGLATDAMALALSSWASLPVDLHPLDMAATANWPCATG
jgi:predicted nucleic acid-binding protein